jgi:hypothetical protein
MYWIKIQLLLSLVVNGYSLICTVFVAASIYINKLWRDVKLYVVNAHIRYVRILNIFLLNAVCIFSVFEISAIFDNVQK